MNGKIQKNDATNTSSEGRMSGEQAQY